MKLQTSNNKIILSDVVFDRKYNYKELQRNDEEIRTYSVKDIKVPSVTTILSATQSKEKQQALQQWRERVGKDEASRITKQASTRGTEMHYVLEQYLNGVGYLNLSEKGELARTMAHTVIDNMSDINTIYGTEVNLEYKQKWAGTCDLVCESNGVLTLGDFKQSNKPKREEWITDYYYQIAAYALAHDLHFGEIQRGLILICTPQLVFQKFIMGKDLLDEYKDRWLARVEKYYYNIESYNRLNF